MGQTGSRIFPNFTTEESNETCVKKCEGKRPQSVIDASKSATQVTQAPAPATKATATPAAATLPPGSRQGGGARKRKIYKKKKSRKSRKSRKSSKKKRRTK